VWAVPASGGAAQSIMEHADAADLHPDGKTLAFVRDEKIWLAAVRGTGTGILAGAGGGRPEHYGFGILARRFQAGGLGRGNYLGAAVPIR
jgi:hypothetical protein